MAADSLSGTEWRLGSAESSRIIEKMRDGAVPLAEFLGATAAFGLKTGLNDAFIIDRPLRDTLIEEDPEAAEVLLPILFGRDVRRYAIEGLERFVIYINDAALLDRHSPVRQHLSGFRSALSKRAGSQRWFELQQPAAAVRQRAAAPKIVYPIIAPECRFTIDTDGHLINDKLFMLDSSDAALLAVLNSRVVNFYFSSVCAALEGGGDKYLEFRAQYVDKLPIPRTFKDFRGKRDLAKFAESLLGLHDRAAAARSPDEKTRLQRNIDAIDRQIDQLVYELYGLTEEEIALLEQDGDEP